MGAKALVGAILVVDDDAAQRAGISGLLERLGFAVIQAGNELEAIEKYTIHHDGISLVIMDILFPSLDGIDATKKIRGIDPSSKIILCSYYIDQFATDSMPDALLQKPYNGRVLWDTIQQVLGLERRHMAFSRGSIEQPQNNNLCMFSKTLIPRFQVPDVDQRAGQTHVQIMTPAVVNLVIC